MQSVKKVKVNEMNNYKQGRSGGKVKQKTGPAVGNASGGKSNGGGIMQKTRGKKGR